MKKYIIRVVERFTTDVEVEAKNEADALKCVENKRKEEPEAFIMCAEEFDTEFFVVNE